MNETVTMVNLMSGVSQIVLVVFKKRPEILVGKIPSGLPAPGDSFNLNLIGAKIVRRTTTVYSLTGLGELAKSGPISGRCDSLDLEELGEVFVPQDAILFFLCADKEVWGRYFESWE